MGVFDGELKLSKLPSKLQNKPEYKAYLYTSSTHSEPSQSSSIKSAQSNKSVVTAQVQRKDTVVEFGGLKY